MKHVLIIETTDDPRVEIYPELGRYIETRIEKAIYGILEKECCIQSRFNVDSAIAAVHEMYGAPKWDPNEEDQ